ncbi:DUF2057 family protein [Pseudoalteromonas fenneropenaei]|uniref:DUF2057 family protein n=1 Tax=Pseudoalteromonas fenneropenaei TaxID=1737459 RepID=A0ABV7CQE7_9GAMM
MINKITSLICLLVSSNVFAATIEFQEEFLPLQVGSSPIEHSLFNKIRKLELAPGQHVVKMKYSDLFELGYDEHEVVESEPFWVSLPISDEGHYIVTFNRPNDVKVARQFAKMPAVVLKNTSSAQQLALNVIATPSIAPIPAVAPIAPVAQVPVAVTTESVQANLADNDNIVPRAPVAMPPSAATMLEYWWQQASVQERAAFMQKYGLRSN